jgi:hypothetical protein
MTDYKELPFDQLKSLHKEIGAFLAEKKQEELEQLRVKMAALGFTPGRPRTEEEWQGAVRQVPQPGDRRDLWRSRPPPAVGQGCARRR